MLMGLSFPSGCLKGNSSFNGHDLVVVTHSHSDSLTKVIAEVRVAAFVVAKYGITHFFQDVYFVLL